MTAETILTQIAVQGFAGLLTNLATSYASKKGRKIPQDAETIKRDLKCRYVRTLGTLPVNSLFWGGGSFHDERATRYSTQT